MNFIFVYPCTRTNKYIYTLKTNNIILYLHSTESINISAEKWKLESDFNETMEHLKMFKNDFKIDEMESTLSDEPEESLCDGIDIMDYQIEEFAHILKVFNATFRF